VSRWRLAGVAAARFTIFAQLRGASVQVSVLQMVI
jgi:hypothetical protein